MFYRSIYVLLLGLLIALQPAHAQDTVRISLTQAEALLFKANLSLLAQKYNISIAEAQVLQARLRVNPNISLQGGVFNEQNGKVVDIGNEAGQYYINAQQLLLLAGKRNKQIALAQTNVALAANSFYDVLRTLKYTLRSNLIEAYYLENSIAAYDTQIQALEKLNTSFETLLTKGTVTLKDAVRIKSLLYSLQTEKTNLQNQLNALSAETQQLLQNNKVVFLPVLNMADLGNVNLSNLSLTQLLDTAYKNRPDLQLANNNTKYAEQNLRYQKALAVTDVTVAGSFDKRGSYIDNARFLTLSSDLPIFNRNQGNIKAAKITIEQNKVLALQQQTQIENEVQLAYKTALNNDKMFKNIHVNFRKDFEELLQNVVQNFEKRNISLLDFTDFYDSYKQNVLQLNQLQNQRAQAFETINYACAAPLLNY